MFRGDHKIKRLQQIPMLRACSPTELRLIASTGDEVAVAAGDVLRRPGTSDRSFFLVLEGRTNLTHSDGHGAVELLTESSVRDELCMETDGHVLVLTSNEFRRSLRASPGFALGIAIEVAWLAAASQR